MENHKKGAKSRSNGSKILQNGALGSSLWSLASAWTAIGGFLASAGWSLGALDGQSLPKVSPDCSIWWAKGRLSRRKIVFWDAKALSWEAFFRNWLFAENVQKPLENF